MSIPYALSSVFIPLFGLVVDRYGFRAICVSISSLILIAVHVILGYAVSIGPIGPLIGQGVAYAMFVAVFWPAVPMVIENRLTGLAFGVAVSVQNGGCALMPVLASMIYTAAGDR
jgi:MFS family permease